MEYPRKLTTFVLTVAMAIVGLLPLAARAAQISGYSDTLSTQSAGAVSDHRVMFVTPSGVTGPSGTITVTFGAGGSFNASSVGVGDIDFGVDGTVPTNDCVGPFTEKTLANSAAAGVWGASFAGQTLTLTPPTDAGAGEIAANVCVRVLIGKQAAFQAAGVNQIVNPAASGFYSLTVGGGFGDSGLLDSTILDTSDVVVSANVGGAAPPGGGGGGGGVAILAPVISNVHAQNIGETTANILWDTDVASNSIVQYGLTSSYGSQASVIGNTFNHTVPLSGLQKGTVYHFRVLSTGVGTPTATSGDHTFTTRDVTAPVISNIRVTNITGTSARIAWDTDEDADSHVSYGVAQPSERSASNAALSNAHVIDLSGLTPETTYVFTVASTDAFGNTATSGTLSFRTGDTIPPIISNVFVDRIMQTTARINWTTNELADTTVEYGTTNTYGSTATDGSLISNHQLTLTGLVANTQYHFRVISSDAFGNTAVSGDGVFRTAQDLVPPANVTNLTVTPGNARDTLTWVNPMDPDFAGVKIRRSISGYPSGPTQGMQVYDGSGTSFIDTGLTNGTKYYYAAFAYDRSGNFASGALASGTPTGPLPLCGNLACDAGETHDTCPSDCAGPVTPPVTPANAIDRSKIEYLAMTRTIRLAPDSIGAYDVLPNASLTLLVPESATAKIIASMTLTLNGNTYALSDDASSSAWVADVSAPSVVGLADGRITIHYADGTTDIVDFIVNVKPLGEIYGTTTGHDAPITGASVTLERKVGETWTAWDALPFFQKNPKTTSADGQYGFMVPAGEYRLVVEKDGYRSRTSAPFLVANAIVDQRIALVALPGAAGPTNVTGNIYRQIQYVIGILVLEVLPDVRVVAALIVAAAVAAIITVITTASAVRPADLGAFLAYLSALPFLFFLGKRKRYGVVYNVLTKLPVDLALVRLLRADGQVLRTLVTGRDGRYAFRAGEGTYRLEVSKTLMRFPTDFYKARIQDGVFHELYHGEPITIGPGGDVIAADIPLDPVESLASARHLIFLAILRRAEDITILVSLAVTLLASLLYPSAPLIALSAFQFICWRLFRRLAWPLRTTRWGMIYDQSTKKPIALALARIVEIEHGMHLDSQVTDWKGRYGFTVGPNTYMVTAEKPGFLPEKTKIIDLAQQKEIKNLDIGLKSDGGPTPQRPPPGPAP